MQYASVHQFFLFIALALLPSCMQDNYTTPEMHTDAPEPKLKEYKRIMIFGRPGSGKSTFAHKLAQHTGLPLHHMDCHVYQAGWVERNHQNLLDILNNLVQQDQWIIDGNNIASLEIRYAQAQTCIYFNYPLWQCYARVFKRFFFYKDPDLKDRAQDCQETIQWRLLNHMWQFEALVAEPIKHLKIIYPHVNFIEVSSDKEAESLLGTFNETKNKGLI